MNSMQINSVIGLVFGIALMVIVTYLIGLLLFGKNFKRFKYRKIIRVFYIAFCSVLFVFSGLLGTLVGLFSISYTCPKYDENLVYTTTEPVDVLVLGDSISSGMLPLVQYSSYGGAGYEFHEMLSKDNMAGNYQNWALPSYSTKDMLFMLEANPDSTQFSKVMGINYLKYKHRNKLNEDVTSVTERQALIQPNTNLNTLISDAEVVYMSIGGNDIARLDYKNLSPQRLFDITTQLQDDINAIVDKIHKINPNAEIYLNMMYYPYMSFEKNLLITVFINLFNTQMEIAHETNSNVYVVDPPIELYTEHKYFRGTEDIHTTPDGYKLMGAKLFDSFIENSNYVNK